MESNSGSASSRLSGGRAAVVRWAALLALPAVEILVLSVRVDTAALAGQHGWWVTVLSHGGAIAASTLAATAACGMMVWAGNRRKRASATGLKAGAPAAHPSASAPVAAAARPLKTVLAFVVAHLAAFVGFAFLSIALVEGRSESGLPTAALLAGWAITGLAMTLFWCLAAEPTGTWRRLAWNHWGAALGGLVIGAAAWTAGHGLGGLWVSLRTPTYWLVRQMLEACGQTTVGSIDLYTLGTPSFVVEISPQCSGYEGLGLILVFLAAYLWLFRRQLRFPQALLLLPAGLLAIWLANAARLAGLILLGSRVSAKIALGGFHSQAGWISFIVVSLGLVAVAHRSAFFSTVERAARPQPQRRDLTTAYLAPLMALMATIMITAALSAGGFDRLYPLRVLVTGAVILIFWRRAVGRVCRSDNWSWTGVAIGVAAFGLWMGLDWMMGPATPRSGMPGELAALGPAWAAAWVICRVAGAVITVPVAEELAFRGYALRRLVAAEFDKVPAGTFTWLSFLGSSVLFGALHGRWLAGTLAGLLYALALYRRGRLGDAILAHATTNALIAGYVLVWQDWSLWG